MSSPCHDEAMTNPPTDLVLYDDENLYERNIRGHISLSFNVVDARSYAAMIRQIREVLTNSESHGIPVLRPQRPETPENALWLDIRLVVGDLAITLRLEQTNLYVRGYQRSTDDFFWEFTDTHLIPGSHDLRFSGGYVGSGSMGDRAGTSREELPLGGTQLDSAIRSLANMADPRAGTNNQAAARNLLVLVQMIAEAARFRTIADHIANNYWNNRARINDAMLAMENGWGNLSTAVLQTDRDPEPNTPLPNIPQINPSNVYTFGQAFAALGILLITRERGGFTTTVNVDDATNDVDDYGRCLMNLEYVLVNNIDDEDPGNLFGTVRVDDGWFTYTFYDRSSVDYEDVGPGGFATLTDPSQSYAVSGADTVVVRVDLFDYDSLSPNDKIAQGEIVWDRLVECVTFENYDKHLERVVKGEDGNVTVGYSVLNNALGVTIQVILVDGDGEDPAEVYGTLGAYQVLEGSAGLAPITLFQKSSKEYVEVGQGQPIPLIRKVMAASTSTKLTIKADLWDHDTVSPDDAIAQGVVDFTVQPGTQKKYINGENGEVQVIITCV